MQVFEQFQQPSVDNTISVWITPIVSAKFSRSKLQNLEKIWIQRCWWIHEQKDNATWVDLHRNFGGLNISLLWTQLVRNIIWLYVHIYVARGGYNSNNLSSVQNLLSYENIVYSHKLKVLRLGFFTLIICITDRIEMQNLDPHDLHASQSHHKLHDNLHLNKKLSRALYQTFE